MSRPVRITTGAAALLAAVSLLSVVPAVPALGLSADACRVTVTESSVSKKSLQAALTVAAAGDHLTVRGVCHGTSTIRRNVTITGIRPAGAVKPVLDGDAGGTVVVVRPGAKVIIKKLAITDGSGEDDFRGCGGGTFVGGGICNKGTLTLVGVAVRDNTVPDVGGGIFNRGTLTLNGSTSVDHNTAAVVGGGIFNKGGTVTLNDSASVLRNTSGNGAIFSTAGGVVVLNDRASLHDNATYGAFVDGETSTITLNDTASVHHNAAAGIAVMLGTATLNDSASIHDNIAVSGGGGVFLYGGTLTLGSLASIHHNTADAGGGVYDEFNTLDDSYCGVQIHDNTPDDCAGP